MLKLAPADAVHLSAVNVPIRLEYTPPGERRRSVEVVGMVDTGATYLSLPRDIVEKLGLPFLSKMTVALADGRVESVDRVGPVSIEIVGKQTHTDCLVLPPGNQSLVGHTVLELLNLIVDCPRARVFESEVPPPQ